MISRAVILATFVTILDVFSPSVRAGSIGLAWDPSPGASGYRVHYGLSAEELSRSADIGAETSATIEELDDCTTWYFAVSAYNTGGESEPSPPVSSWPRPVVSRVRPAVDLGRPIGQGARLSVIVEGASFRDGSLITLDAAAGRSCPSDPLEAAACQAALRTTVRLEQVERVSCFELTAVATVEPTAEGLPPARVGDYVVDVIGPSGPSATGILTVSMNEARFDINRESPPTEGRLDGRDIVWLARVFGQCDPILHGHAACSPSNYDPDYDFDGDGFVDGQDLELLAMNNLGKTWNGMRWVCPPGATGCSD